MPPLSFSKIALFLTAAITISACTPEASDTENAPEERARPAKIHTLSTSETAVLRSYPATLEARQKANLAFRVSGQLTELPAKAGALVQKGELLARLDNADYQNALDARQAAYQLAKVQYDQAKELNTKRLASQLQLDQSIASLKSAKANLTQAEDNFRYTELTAPFDGVVARVDIDNHQAVQAGTPVLQLQGLDQLDISFSVPESLISQMNRIENPAVLDAVCGEVIFTGHPDESFAACHKEHELVPDPLTRNYKALFSVQNRTDFSALPGMSATIVLDFSAFMPNAFEPVLIAPIEAVHEFEGANWVWRLNDQMRAERVQVTLGELGDQGFTVLSGLAAGDKIVTAGLSHVRQDMLLKALVKERGL